MRTISPEENGLQWLFLDLNSYFASVEQQENPALRGRPIAVVPMDTDSTCAIAASYEAKAYGIKTGTMIYDAKRMCPKLICVEARHDKYVEYHHRVIDEVIRHVPIDKICSIDELSSRLPPRQRNRTAAIEVAHRIKAGLRRNVGEYITCSIGIAPNSFLAKVATDMQKPDGLVVLAPQELPGRLLKLKLTDLPGINVNMEARLKRAGITSVEQLWDISPKHARAAWRSVGGEKFWYNLHGYDIPDTQTKTTTIGHSRVLEPALRNPAAARLVARRLTIKAAGRLRRTEFYATRFYFSARAADGNEWAGEARLSPSQDNFAFLKALDDLWAEMIADIASPSPFRERDGVREIFSPPLTLPSPRRGEGLMFKKVSLALHGLCRRDEITPDLFDTSSETYQKLAQKNETISRAMDRLNEKYGAETLKLGVSPQTQAGYVGTKIAFARIPDAAEFWE